MATNSEAIRIIEDIRRLPEGSDTPEQMLHLVHTLRKMVFKAEECLTVSLSDADGVALENLLWAIEILACEQGTLRDNTIDHIARLCFSTEVSDRARELARDILVAHQYLTVSDRCLNSIHDVCVRVNREPSIMKAGNRAALAEKTRAHVARQQEILEKLRSGRIVIPDSVLETACKTPEFCEIGFSSDHIEALRRAVALSQSQITWDIAIPRKSASGETREATFLAVTPLVSIAGLIAKWDVDLETRISTLNAIAVQK